MSLYETADKIKSMEIRGAGRIARYAAQALKEHGNGLKPSDLNTFQREMEKASEVLLKTRPTAVSLPNAVNIVMREVRAAGTIEDAKEKLTKTADSFIEDSINSVSKIAEFGSRHIKDGDTILTHCNSEAALACIIKAHEDGKEIEVFATEVRPRNQGLITIKTLNDAGIKTSFIVDSAARYYMKRVNLAITGADAITVNGAVVNKIGTSQIALCAKESRTPLIVAAETYKFAPKTVSGDLIDIEERPSSEVLDDSILKDLKNVRVRNPAFDVTPAAYIDLIITEKGAIPPEMAYTIIKEYLGWKIEEFS
ncbi:ribose 1,5-bisphosphate isomerase [Methanoplanus sp. FWC-SCC4]|uniref:Ribose 1,5-bisphosphate isomerase n=1 Tax=Methanochimaera problematica TaxID=2609417 RepID=A0AA97I2X4_9EURY|nr:ribose 1,5-bisphosphate isomerase [Methanoplanus sp. FWC-SCC4]WOF16755.1 ribose 1,5-bisphosphate isomerase [Methanoplanus sp. FWC-SCC4]